MRVGVGTVAVGVRVFVLVGDGTVAVLVGVLVRVGDGTVAVLVGVRDGVRVIVGVFVIVGVRVIVGVFVIVGVLVRVGVRVMVGVFDGVGVLDGVGVACAVTLMTQPFPRVKLKPNEFAGTIPGQAPSYDAKSKSRLSVSKSLRSPPTPDHEVGELESSAFVRLSPSNLILVSVWPGLAASYASHVKTKL